MYPYKLRFSQIYINFRDIVVSPNVDMQVAHGLELTKNDALTAWSFADKNGKHDESFAMRATRVSFEAFVGSKLWTLEKQRSLPLYF